MSASDISHVTSHPDGSMTAVRRDGSSFPMAGERPPGHHTDYLAALVDRARAVETLLRDRPAGMTLRELGQAAPEISSAEVAIAALHYLAGAARAVCDLEVGRGLVWRLVDA